MPGIGAWDMGIMCMGARREGENEGGKARGGSEWKYKGLVGNSGMSGTERA